MRKHRGSLLIVLTVLFLASTSTAARAQSSRGAPGAPVVSLSESRAGSLSGSASSPFYVPPGYAIPAAAYYPPPAGYTASGLGMVYPASFTDGGGPGSAPQPLPQMSAEPAPYGTGVQPGGYDPGASGSCPYCGGAGCENCVGTGLLGSLFAGCCMRLLPYGEGGCCAPRWYDITADALLLKRENVCRQIDFTSLHTLGPIVLGTNNLDFDTEAGLRVTGALQIWAGGNLEFTYFGLHNWASAAQFTDPDAELYSVLSDFGSNPIGGFDETDRSVLQSIAYSSSLNNFELHFRKRWTGPNCRLQGSWLAGVRYIYLVEDFAYNTIGGGDDPQSPVIESRGSMAYDVRTKNSVTGFQFGGDLWTCIIPGISLGGELKVGVYGNYAQQGTQIVATTTEPLNTAIIQEKDTSTDAAFASEANLMLIYRLSPNWTFRTGYSLIYINGVALAAENFNAEPPWTEGTSRVVTVNDNGAVFYHGFNAGFEWMW